MIFALLCLRDPRLFVFLDVSATKVIDTFQKNREKTTTTDKLGAAMEALAVQCEGHATNMSAH